MNGVDASSLLQQLLSATPGDGEIAAGRIAVLNQDWHINKYAQALAGIQSPFALTVRDSNKNILVKGRTLPELKKEWSEKFERATNLQFRQNGDVALLTISAFYGSAEDGSPLAAFLDSVFIKIREAGSTTLILDLRNNGGGYDHLGVQLVSYLVDRPYLHYSDIRQRNLKFSFEKYLQEPIHYPVSFFSRGKDKLFHATGHPNWGTQRNREPGFRGKVFVLMNGGSFSTTSEVIAQLRFHKRAQFIGEECGGGYTGNNAGFMPILVLPHSRIRVELPLTAYDLAVTPFSHRGVLPDHPVVYEISDLLNGKDKDLALALKIAQEQ
jgi:C-terminal processing protease CtpA/Prc